MLNTLKIIPVVILLSISSVSISACNTMEGFGQDVERAGEGIQGQVEKDPYE